MNPKFQNVFKISYSDHRLLKTYELQIFAKYCTSWIIIVQYISWYSYFTSMFRQDVWVYGGVRFPVGDGAASQKTRPRVCTIGPRRSVFLWPEWIGGEACMTGAMCKSSTYEQRAHGRLPAHWNIITLKKKIQSGQRYYIYTIVYEE